jgi:uncharacterized protein (TIGR03067 family)
MLWQREGLVLAACGVLVAVAGLQAEDKVEGDLKKMQGDWTWANPMGGDVAYTFKGKTLLIKGQTRSYEMTITIDEKVKPDKTIDMKIDKAPDDAKGKTSLGIYKFDGDDKLIICFRPEGTDRPKKYENVGFEQFVAELKRKK